MAVSRGSVAFWVGFVRIHGRRQQIVSQLADSQWLCPARPLSSASWALAPPNSLRYQSVKKPVLSHPFHHASQPQKAAYNEDDWEESLRVCVLVRLGESGTMRTTMEIPLFGQTKLAELLTPGTYKSSELSFLLTTVDGSREDDINIVKKSGGDTEKRQHSFRSLFKAEKCPAPYIYGSHFYCFHCPGTRQSIAHDRLNFRQNVGLESDKMKELHATLCSQAAPAEGHHHEGDSEREQRLAMVYERLRSELPSFFHKTHDYSLYSNDVEFINGLLNTKTRGRFAYQFNIAMSRFLCLMYFVDVRLEVLKLTKHPEDGTIKARWRLRGLPFFSLMLRIYRRDKSQLYRFYDAFSTFYVGHNGLIHCHKVEKVMQAPPPVLPRVTSLLASALIALGVQENRPALNLLPLLLSSRKQVRD